VSRSDWDAGDVVAVMLFGALIIAGLALVGWPLWSAVNDHRDMSRCRDRGGNVEHVGTTTDWRCVGAGPERAR
jgi:hypothetical protein